MNAYVQGTEESVCRLGVHRDGIERHQYIGMVRGGTPLGTRALVRRHGVQRAGTEATMEVLMREVLHLGD